MIKEIILDEARIAAVFACKLWPSQTVNEFEKEMELLIKDDHAAVLLAYQNNEAIGFAQCQIRFDYVEGTNSSPVGYLEGLYVLESYRKSGIARELVKECERWAKRKGCSEFASDCELGNEQSLAMHLRLGFTEANRIICFRKDI
ncbi:aminoglycoside 6'-N-acetyltransferase [Oceanobacillus kimchii]|uniref:aminoglycoside 6'-N-acetyltransferase n=1 Tax=Oceanobacillus kimchii TaxID=746691 RepID=UPI00034BA116|nr:aminoglycoside 6'-N-acetyltransferase [Oceanobacillus kimchii]